MSSISFGGLASGIDTDSIIKALLEAERQPLNRLEHTRDYETAKLEAFRSYHDKLGALNRSIDRLYLSSTVQDSKVSLSSEEYVTASASSASPGTYNIAVEQTAQVQKSSSDRAFASRSEQMFEPGEIVFQVGDKAHTVMIEEGRGSLSDVMGAINRSSSGHGISASIIDAGGDGAGEDGGRYYLMLSGADSATSFEVLSAPPMKKGGEPLSLAEPLQAARHAIAYIDGIKVTSRTNTISDALNGVTLNLEGTSPTGEDGRLVSTTLTIAVDNDAMIEKIEGFVDAYNEIVSYVNGINQDAEDEDNGAGMLKGDALVNTVTRRLQGMMSNRVTDSGTYDALSQLGLATRRDGTISFDKTVMETALKEDYGQVVELMAGDKGIFKDYRSYLNNMTSTRDGVFATREDSTKSMMKRIDRDIERMETRLDRREEFLMKRFTAMEQMVNMFNSQSEFLTNQMDRMPSIGGKK